MLGKPNKGRLELGTEGEGEIGGVGGSPTQLPKNSRRDPSKYFGLSIKR